MKTTPLIMTVLVLLLGGISYSYNRELTASDVIPGGTGFLVSDKDTIYRMGTCYTSHPKSVGYTTSAPYFPEWGVSNYTADSTERSQFTSIGVCTYNPQPNFADSNFINDTVGTNSNLVAWETSIGTSPETWIIFGLGLGMVIYLRSIAIGIGSVINLFNIFNRGEE